MLWAFIAVFGFLALVLWLTRRSRRSDVTTHVRLPRLTVIDAASIDDRRLLILIRRDNAEHLLMVGGPTDVVIERNIVRAATTPRGTTDHRPPLADDTLPRAVPLDELSEEERRPLERAIASLPPGAARFVARTPAGPVVLVAPERPGV